MLLVYARRPSFSLCVTVPDWVPVQLFQFKRECEALPRFDKHGGPYCPVKFVKTI